MSRSDVRLLLAAVLVLLVVAVPVVLPSMPSAARLAGPPTVSFDGTIEFGPTVSATDRADYLAAIAAARPLAQRLVDRVDGAVVLHSGVPRDGAAGLASGSRSAGWDVTIDFAGVRARHGARGVARVVLHELAHVVDHALVDPSLAARMDAATPVGWGCDNGTDGACAAREERFAESFAKWATNDAGVDIYLGYRVPPPDLERWGEPLAPLAAGGS